MTRVPDIAGEIVAYRAWEVWDYRPPRGPVLSSITNTTHWGRREWLVAHCHGRTRDVPHEGHACGIYAARDLPHLFDQGYNAPDRDSDIVAIGAVALAGKVIRCERGWRAERARPLRLWLPYDHWRLLAPLSDAYGVPVALADTFADVDLEVLA